MFKLETWCKILNTNELDIKAFQTNGLYAKKEASQVGSFLLIFSNDSKLEELVRHAEVICFVVIEWFRGLTRISVENSGRERPFEFPQGRLRGMTTRKQRQSPTAGE